MYTHRTVESIKRASAAAGCHVKAVRFGTVEHACKRRHIHCIRSVANARRMAALPVGKLFCTDKHLCKAQRIFHGFRQHQINGQLERKRAYTQCKRCTYYELMAPMPILLTTKHYQPCSIPYEGGGPANHLLNHSTACASAFFPLSASSTSSSSALTANP